MIRFSRLAGLVLALACAGCATDGFYAGGDAGGHSHLAPPLQAP